MKIEYFNHLIIEGKDGWRSTVLELLTEPTNMGEYSSKKSLSCQTLDFVNPYLTNFVLEHYLRFLGYFENLELKDLGI